MIDTSKIIHAPVGGGRYTVTAPIVKEDYGLYLKIEGLELPTTYEVDFSNSEHSGTSVTMIGNADGVLIPSQFISSGKDVFAFLYHVGADFGRTVYKFRIPNKLRPDRTNEQPTPEEQSVIDQAISALNSAVAQTSQDVIDADASAQSASESAEQAQESARTAGLYSDTAQTYANSAEISANSASASATASAQSASQSAQIKADVEDLAEEAQASASASAQSATASANSASQASASATSASQSASSAQGYASQAQTSAQTASSKASEASTSASTASTQASEALSSALSASGYATQAESAKTASQTAQGLAESARDDAIDAKTDAESARDEAQSIVDGINAKAEQIEINNVVSSLTEDYIPIPCKAKTENKYIRYTTGAESNDSTLIYSASEYVDVSQFAIIKYSHTSSVSSTPYNGMAFYDDNKEYLFGYQAVKNASEAGYDDELFVIRVHPRAKYARFSMYTDSQIYGEFELYGISKLSENFYGFLKADNTLINREHGYINYNYDVPYDRPANLFTTDSTRVGIKRYNEMLTINYDGSASTNVVIRLSGTIDSRLGTNITAWTEGIVLETGKSYKVKAELISGTIVPDDGSSYGWSISVYKTGTSSTVGTYERDGNVYTRTFTAEEDTQYNIAFYLVRTAVLTNAVFLITLEEADATAYYTEQETNELLDYYDAKTNELHNLVDYGYGSAKNVLLPSGGASDGSIVGVERYRTKIKLNLEPAGYVKRVFLSGNIRRYSGSSSYKNAEGYLQLKEGHKYRATLKWLSGTALRSDIDYLPDIAVYVSKGSSTIATAEYTSATEKRVTFTAPADLLNVVIYVASNTTLTDALYDVTLEEIVEDSDLPDYYLAELTDTVNKVRNETTAPAIVFTTAADIHRHSSNADGVQTFTQMITAMRKLSEQCKVDFILNLGDLTDGNTVQATTLERAYQCLSEFMSIGVPYFWAMGNHDTNYAVSGHPYIFDMDQCYKAYFTAIKGVTFNADEQGTDYYIDFDGMGTRLIVLNANNLLTGHVEYVYGNTTATWLTSALNTDKTVLLAMHQSPIRDQVYNRQSTDGATDIVNALQTFVSNGGNLIMMSGHSHLDMAFIDPWLSVMQDCQRFSNTAGSIITPDSEDTHSITGFIDNIVKPARVQYTASEDAWSVNIYKPLTNEFAMIRFGAGADRYFHVTPIAPTTVTSKLNGTLTWSTSDDSVATVADGVITGIATGKCAILAKDADGNYECWVVNVP